MDGGPCPSTVGQQTGRPAMVVFVDQSECRWLRALRRGFRHCFAVLRDGPFWLACDPLLDRIELHCLDLPPGYDLAGSYAAQGHVVLTGHTDTTALPRAVLPLVALTCVTVTKRLLGVHAPGVLTPWQLHRHLVTRAGRPFAAVAPPAAAAEASRNVRREFLLDTDRNIRL